MQLKKEQNEDFDQDIIDEGLDARIQVESYAHWIVTSMNMSLILEYAIETSLWDVVKRDR